MAALAVATLSALSRPAEADSEPVRKRANAIRFAHDLDSALQQAESAGKPIYLVFGAVWCPVCRHLEEVTLLEHPMQAMADDFIWVKVDVDRNMSLAREWGVEATPTIFLFDPASNSRHTIVGGPSAEELSATMNQFLAELAANATPGKAPTTDDTVKTDVFQHTQLTVKPNGFRGKSVCFSHVGYGPLSIRSQSPFQSLRLGIAPRTPSTLGRGEHQAKVGGTWSNTWTHDTATFDPAHGDLGAFLLDFEALDLSLAYSYGITDTFQFDVEYEQRVRFGGAMDGFIEGFHDLFGLGQARRDEFPRDQTNIFIDARNGSPPVSLLGSDASGTFARDLLLTFQHNVTCGTSRWPAFSWAVTGRHSLGNPGELEGSSFDLAVSVAAARRVGEVYLYLTLGYAWYGSDAVYGLELKATQATALAAAEWRFKPRMSFVLQYLGSQGAAKDLGVFSELSNEVVVGWKWEARPAGVLEIGLIENILEFGNSPDFGVHVGWTQRF